MDIKTYMKEARVVTDARLKELLPEETLKVSINVNPDQTRTVSWED
jgi:hypothetical protein